MAFRFILLVLPALVLAGIEVEISGEYSENAKNLTVHYKGYDIDIISETERTTFNVNDTILKNCAQAYFGKRPKDVFVRNPTPWGELNSNSQVYRILVPRNGKIIEVTETPTLVARPTFENNNTIPVTLNVGMSQSIVNRVLFSWRTSGELSGIQINHSIKIKVGNVAGEPYFNYTSSWGQHTLQSQTVAVGAPSNMNMTLHPGDAFVALLKTTRRLIVKIEMEYNARLSGKIAANLYEGDYGWYTMPIDVCMTNAGLSNQKKSREFIDVEFFLKSKVSSAICTMATSSWNCINLDLS